MSHSKNKRSYSVDTSNNTDTSNAYVRCPKCGRLTNSLKCFKLADFYLFLLFGASYSNETDICCPSCMRKRILLKHFTYNIITGNILWMFMLMPWGIINLIRTTTKGHSRTVRKIIEENPEVVHGYTGNTTQPPVYPDFNS